MTDQTPYHINVNVVTHYIEEQSSPEIERYVFAYTIKIRNLGEIPATLLARHWVITDSNGKIEKVSGRGVIGKHPCLNPGEEFEYTSGAIIATPVGTMEGTYQMIAKDGVTFSANIPAFTLSIPRVLH